MSRLVHLQSLQTYTGSSCRLLGRPVTEHCNIQQLRDSAEFAFVLVRTLCDSAAAPRSTPATLFRAARWQHSSQGFVAAAAAAAATAAATAAAFPVTAAAVAAASVRYRLRAPTGFSVGLVNSGAAGSTRLCAVTNVHQQLLSGGPLHISLSGSRAYSSQKQQQPRQLHCDGLQEPWSRESQHAQPARPRHRRPLQQPPKYSLTPWKFMLNKQVARQLARAFEQQQQQQQVERPALLHTALKHMLQQLPRVPPGDVSALLHCFELAGTAVPLPAMQQLLLHLADHLQACKTPVIMRALRSASHSFVAAAPPAQLADSTRQDSGSDSDHLQAAIRQLLQQLWTLKERSSVPLRPSSVPQLLRCISVLQAASQTQLMPEDMLDNYVQYWLDSCPATSSSASGNGAADNSTSAAQAGMLVKAVQVMGLKLAEPELQRLLVMLLSAATCSNTTVPSGTSSSSSDAVWLQLQDAAATPAAALAAAQWLPTLLCASHQLDRAGSLQEQQRARILQLASQTLQSLAAALPLVHSSHALQAVNSSSSSSSSSSKMGRSSGAGHAADPPTPAAVADGILQVIKALSTVHRASPINKVPGLVDRLAAALLAADADFEQLAMFMSVLAGLNLSLSVGCMAQLTAAACAQAARSPAAGCAQQSRAGRTGARVSSRRDSVSQYLWACSSMGYTLRPSELALLLRLQLSRLQRPLTLHATQSLWALANMGAVQAQDQQLQPAQLMARQQAESPAALQGETGQLACRLLSLILQEQQSSMQDSSSRVTGAYQGPNTGGSATGSSTLEDPMSSSSGSSSSGEDLEELNVNPWLVPGAPCRVQGNVAWQLSLACWAAAMCNLTMCKDTVLQLCSILARPQVWASLRYSELVQLVAVHLWLTSDFKWSDSAGLAAVLAPEQLQRLKQARVLQTWSLSRAYAGPMVLPASAGLPGQQHPQQQAQQQLLELVAQVASQSQLQELQQLDPQCLPQKPPPGKRKAKRQPQRPAPMAQHLGTSSMQAALCTVLQKLPDVRFAQLEALTPDLLFTVDVLVETAAGQQVAFEFDGPHHYSLVVPAAGPAAVGAAADSSTTGLALEGRSAAAAGAGSAARMDGAADQPAHQRDLTAGLSTGSAVVQPAAQACAPGLLDPQRAAATAAAAADSQAEPAVELVPVRRVVFRNRALKARGYKVVCVPYFEWGQLSSKSQQQRYLQQLLAQG